MTRCLEALDGVADEFRLDDFVDREGELGVEAALVAPRAARGFAGSLLAEDFEGAVLAAQDVAFAGLRERAHVAQVVIDRGKAALAQLLLKARAVAGVA